MKIAVLRLLILTLLSLTFISWGFYGHRKINRYAVYLLPPEMIGFYKKHIDYITQHAIDPDKRRYIVESEAVKHYIDLDHYPYQRELVFDSIPMRWQEAKDKFSQDTLMTYGVLPWNINWVHQRLTKAFQEKRPKKILSLSADLGHYIADAHVPLHTTENYNGQLSDQVGIHALWESRIPELEGEGYDLLLAKAYYINNPLEECWQIIQESHYLVDSVLHLEKVSTLEVGEARKYSMVKRGSVLSKNYSDFFVSEYSLKMSGMVEERMQLAIRRVAAFWFTAWINAGQPDISDLRINDRVLQRDSLKNDTVKKVKNRRKHE